MEVKFKIWVKNEKYMKTTRAAVNTIISYFILDSPQKENYIALQYTEYKDKNGVEGYEGDIWTDGGSNKFVIKKKGGCWKLIGMLFPYEYSITHLPAGEIIGNIYENKNLIKGGNNE